MLPSCSPSRRRSSSSACASSSRPSCRALRAPRAPRAASPVSRSPRSSRLSVVRARVVARAGSGEQRPVPRANRAGSRGARTERRFRYGRTAAARSVGTAQATPRTSPRAGSAPDEEAGRDGGLSSPGRRRESAARRRGRSSPKRASYFARLSWIAWRSRFMCFGVVIVARAHRRLGRLRLDVDEVERELGLGVVHERGVHEHAVRGDGIDLDLDLDRLLGRGGLVGHVRSLYAMELRGNPRRKPAQGLGRSSTGRAYHRARGSRCMPRAAGDGAREAGSTARVAAARPQRSREGRDRGALRAAARGRGRALGGRHPRAGRGRGGSGPWRGARWRCGCAVGMLSGGRRSRSSPGGARSDPRAALPPSQPLSAELPLATAAPRARRPLFVAEAGAGRRARGAAARRRRGQTATSSGRSRSPSPRRARSTRTSRRSCRRSPITCAQALERARLFEAERVARLDAQRAQEATRRALDTRDRLVGIVGHDLRTPLAAIRMSIAVLFQRGGLSEDQVRTLARIAASAVRMTRIIRDLLDFSRLSASGCHSGRAPDRRRHAGRAPRGRGAAGDPPGPGDPRGGLRVRGRAGRSGAVRAGRLEPRRERPSARGARRVRPGRGGAGERGGVRHRPQRGACDRV